MSDCSDAENRGRKLGNRAPVPVSGVVCYNCTLPPASGGQCAARRARRAENSDAIVFHMDGFERELGKAEMLPTPEIHDDSRQKRIYSKKSVEKVVFIVENQQDKGQEIFRN